MNDTNQELIDVLDDSSVVVKDKLVFTQPTTVVNRRYFIVIKGNIRSKIVFNTRLMERSKPQAFPFANSTAMDTTNPTYEQSKSKSKHANDKSDNSGPLFKFQQCSFIIVDFNKKRTKSTSTMFELESSFPLEFTDCTFMGIRKEDIGDIKKPLKYQIFGNFPTGHSLTIENCFFKGLQSVYQGNKPPYKLEVINCTFEEVLTPCLQISNPYYCLISGCTFYNIQEYCIEINVDCFYEEYHFAKKFGTPLKHQYTVIIRKNKFTTCENGILIHSQKLILQQLPLQIFIFQNELINQIKNGMIFENLLLKSLEIMDNVITSSGFAGVIIINTKSFERAVFQKNNLFSNTKMGICIENSELLIQNSKFSRSITGIWINFGNFDHLKDSISSNNSGIYLNGKKDSQAFQNRPMGQNLEPDFKRSICEIKNSGFFDISKYGVIVASNHGGVISCERCVFEEMQAGICIKETCTGTISKKVGTRAKHNIVDNEKVEDQLQTLTNRESQQVSSKISIRQMLKHTGDQGANNGS